MAVDAGIQESIAAEVAASLRREVTETAKAVKLDAASVSATATTVASLATEVRTRQAEIEGAIAGNVPEHEWDGYSVRLRNPDGEWGAWINLRGEKGDEGDPGPDGLNVYTSASVPSSSFGRDGETHLHSVTGELRRKMAGAWVVVGNLSQDVTPALRALFDGAVEAEASAGAAQVSAASHAATAQASAGAAQVAATSATASMDAASVSRTQAGTFRNEALAARNDTQSLFANFPATLIATLIRPVDPLAQTTTIADELKRAPYLDNFYRTTDAGNWALTLARAKAATKFLRLHPNRTYTLKTGFVDDVGLSIDGQGATFVVDGDIYPYTVDLPYLSERSVTSITNEVVDLNGTGANDSGDTSVSVLNLPSAAGYAAGQIVKVVSDDLHSWDKPANNERYGEFATVSQVIGNAVYLRARLQDEAKYTTGIRVAIVDTSKRVRLHGLKFDYSGGFSDGWSNPYLTVIGAAFPVLTDIMAERSMSELVDLTGCYGARTLNITGRNIRSDFPNYAYGYVLLSCSSENGVHLSLYGDNVRHVYTTGTKGTAPGDDIRKYGSTRNEQIRFGVGFNCQHSAFDTHGDAENIEFLGCIARYQFSGPNGTRQGFAFRGHDCRAIDCVAQGGHGFVAFTSYGKPGNSGGHEFINCRYYSNPSYPDLRNAFRAEGRAGEDGNGDAIVDVKFIGCRSYTTQGIADAAVYATRANVELIDTVIAHPLAGTNQGAILARDGSTVRIRGGMIDVTGSSGSGLSVFREETADSAIYTSGGVEVLGCASVNNLVNNANTAATSHLLGLNLDADISTVLAGSSAGVTSIDYTVNDGRSSGYAVRTPPTLAVGNNSVDLGYRAGATILLRLRAVNNGVFVNEITAGKRFGQELFVVNRMDSSNAITILAGGANISIPYSVVIPAGGSLLLVWDGTSWVGGENDVDGQFVKPGNASVTLTANSPGTVLYDAPISANRNVSLPTAANCPGKPFDIVRTANATGAFNVTVATSLKTLATAGTWTRVRSDGTNWIVVGGGTL